MHLKLVICAFAFSMILAIVLNDNENHYYKRFGRLTEMNIIKAHFPLDASSAVLTMQE